MNYKIHIIIVTYNAMKWAEKCFSSLRKSSISVKTIVVDNGSTDGTQEYVKTNFPEVHFIQSPENLGFGKANNIGIEVAYKEGADFFYLMNQDAWLFQDSIQELLNVYNSYEDKEEIGILSPMHLDGSEKLLDFHFERYIARSTEENRAISGFYLGKMGSSFEINFVNAAHWFLPKQTVEIVGGFNPFFFHGAEDYDYANRVHFHKKKIIVATKSKVVHDAKKLLKEKPAKEKLAEKRTSIRMQRETRYMNITAPFDASAERKEFLSNITKLALKGKIDESRFYREMYQYFNPLFPQIEKNRKIAAFEKHPFLNLIQPE